MKSRDLFRKIFPLTSRQPWLGELTDQLESLLFDDCKNEEQSNLIIDLLERFSYLDSSQFQAKLNELALAIVTDADLIDSKTIVVAMAADSSTDSSQLILYSLKSLLEKYSWRDYLAVNRYDHVYRKLRDYSGVYTDIVLVDEFIGSGDTVINRISQLKSTFAGNGLSGYKFRVKVIAATTAGLERVKQEGIEVEAMTQLAKGISDHFNPEDISTMISHMVDIESCLLEQYKDRNLPSLGYNEAEALYARADGNTPNSVFPVFWWRFYKGGKDRLTLLNRAMGDA